MQFEFKNLGTIKEAQLEMGNLTVICGKNNTGKTYLTYGVWGILGSDFSDEFYQKIFKKEKKDEPKDKILNIEEFSEAIYEKGEYTLNVNKELMDISRNFANKLFKYEVIKTFAMNDTLFSNLEIKSTFRYKEVSLETSNFLLTLKLRNNLPVIYIKRKDDNSIFNEEKEKQLKPYNGNEVVSVAILNMLIKSRLYYPEKSFAKNTFLLPAQRDSIELFYKELDKNRSHLLEKLRTTRDLSLLDKESSRFPQPIEKLIDFARDLTRQVIKTESFLAKEQPELLKEIENLLGVTYEVSGDEVLIKDKYSTQKVPAYMASTSVRSLMHLHFWLKHKAQKGDLLMIDEPELNLHPENQIKMARLFAKLVNAGIKVWITTHSDYIIKELNNCLMLSQEMENKNEILEELGYKENEILQRDDIRAYIAHYDEKLEGCTVDKVEFDEYGMVMTTFDDQARKINRIAHRLADEIDEKQLKQTSLEND